MFKSIALIATAGLAVAAHIPAARAASHGSVRAASHAYYSRAHSLGDSYQFDPRDGWEPVNVTNAEQAQPHGKRAAADVENVVKDVWDGIKAIGSPEPVEITWYTGKDLLNPSCWSSSGWHPSDASFAAAVTLSGWKSKPKCFNFLELCNTPKKCVFVRVVDTCAGCAAGSKHCDLTRAAFGQLADFAEGALTVQLRAATGPSSWHEDLWGPKA